MITSYRMFLLCCHSVSSRWWHHPINNHNNKWRWWWRHLRQRTNADVRRSGGCGACAKPSTSAIFFVFERDDARTCRGCIGCDPDSFDFNTIDMTSPQEGGKEVLRAQFASVQGDRGNPSYSRELDATDDVIVPTVTSTTGDKGNPHYSAELDSTPPQQQQQQQPSVFGGGSSVFGASSSSGPLGFSDLLQSGASSSTSGFGFGQKNQPGSNKKLHTTKR